MAEPVLIGRLKVAGAAASGATADANGANGANASAFAGAFAGPFAAADPLLTRLRAEHLLQRADLHPPGLPPGAILVVRRLRGPAVGDALSGSPTLAHPWEQATRAAIAELLHRAARPLYGPPPAGAEAVLFADRAELLACLALDWLGGRLAGRWWWDHLRWDHLRWGHLRWTHLLAQAGPREAVSAAWARAAEFAPAGLAHLAARGAASAFAAALLEAECAALLGQVVERFGLPHLLPLAAALAGPPSPAPAAEAESAPPAGPPAPWAALLPQPASSLSPPRQALLGVGLALVHQPWQARGAGFGLAARRWLAAAQGQPSTPSPPAPPPARPPRTQTPAAQAALPAADRAGFPSQAGDPPADLTGPAASPRSPRPAAAIRPRSAPPGQAGSTAEAALPPPAPAAQPPPAEPSTPAEPAPLALEPPPETERTTQFGGLFYLINLALRLGLYGDFTTPREPGLDLPIWDLLALLGEELLGPALREDPAWDLLAELSARGAAPPGDGFTPPEEWITPAEWLAPFEPLTCRWQIAESLAGSFAGRLKPRQKIQKAKPSPTFVGLKRRTSSRSYAARRNEKDAVKRRLNPTKVGDGFAFWNSCRGFNRPAHPAHSASPLRRWIRWLAAYARARLELALGLEPGEDLTAVLFAHPARVRLSAARLDIFLSLAELPLAVRMAGLDRDPGWVPAAGRWIAFHFA